VRNAFADLCGAARRAAAPSLAGAAACRPARAIVSYWAPRPGPGRETR
jgi:hypothetical protein